jgi:tetratricopeptide (TPR) repeat protein
MLHTYIIDFLSNPLAAFKSPVFLVLFLFTLWMFIDAIRREEWIWAAFIFVFPVINAILYFFLVWRASRPLNAPTFELPGAGQRRRIKVLQDQIHHLDKAHHHSQLADVYFAQGKLADAEKEYLLALQRDSEDIDTIAHYGQCLLRLGRAKEALPVLEKVVRQNPEHEYGATLMMYAEALGELGERDAAIQSWRQVLERHSYAQAKVHLARLLIARGDKETARRELQEVIADAGHGPAFQRKREKAWAKEAASLLKTI